MSKRILVVDDDEMMRKLLKDVLAYYNYEIETATNGEEAHRNIAEKIAKTEKFPDMIITDLEMPEMSGEELAEKIGDLNILNGSNIKVILMSGNHDELHRIEKSAIRKNIDLFIQKPLSPSRFLVEVENLLQ